jgi:hypothetical protein
MTALGAIDRSANLGHYEMPNYSLSAKVSHGNPKVSTSHDCVILGSCKKPASSSSFDATIYRPAAYGIPIDIDSTYCFAIIRRHLASQATSEATVEPADCSTP